MTVAESADISPLALQALVNHALGNDVTSGYVQLSVDQEIADNSLSRPLAFIERLVFDMAAGAKPPALTPNVEIEKNGKLVTP